MEYKLYVLSFKMQIWRLNSLQEQKLAAVFNWLIKVLMSLGEQFLTHTFPKEAGDCNAVGVVAILEPNPGVL